jgi:hypothetical protein
MPHRRWSRRFEPAFLLSELSARLSRIRTSSVEALTVESPWGLFFLLDVDAQRRLIQKIVGALSSGGRLLFTAPKQSCSWQDAMTGRFSISMGQDAYREALAAEGNVTHWNAL